MKKVPRSTFLAHVSRKSKYNYINMMRSFTLIESYARKNYNYYYPRMRCGNVLSGIFLRPSV